MNGLREIRFLTGPARMRFLHRVRPYEILAHPQAGGVAANAGKCVTPAD